MDAESGHVVLRRLQRRPDSQRIQPFPPTIRTPPPAETPHLPPPGVLPHPAQFLITSSGTVFDIKALGYWRRDIRRRRSPSVTTGTRREIFPRQTEVSLSSLGSSRGCF